MLLHPFDFPLQQQSTQMLAQYVAAPYGQDLAGILDMHGTARPGMPPHPSSLLQSSSLLGLAPLASAQHRGLHRHDDPVQQLQDGFETPAERIRSSTYTTGVGEGPAGTVAEKAPTVRSSLQGSSGQKKKVPMHCQVSSAVGSLQPCSSAQLDRYAWHKMDIMSSKRRFRLVGLSTRFAKATPLASCWQPSPVLTSIYYVLEPPCCVKQLQTSDRPVETPEYMASSCTAEEAAAQSDLPARFAFSG